MHAVLYYYCIVCRQIFNNTFVVFVCVQAKKAKQAEIDRKRAEVRKRMEEASKAKKAKKGFMTPDRKKKLRVSIIVYLTYCTIPLPSILVFNWVSLVSRVRAAAFEEKGGRRIEERTRAQGGRKEADHRRTVRTTEEHR